MTGHLKGSTRTLCRHAPLVRIVVSQEPNDSVELLPGTSNIEGSSPVVTEKQIGYWGNLQNSVSWLLEQNAGRFEVRIE